MDELDTIAANLASHPCFRGCRRENLLRLAEKAVVTDFDSGDTIFYPNEEKRFLGLILRGEVKVLSSDPARQLLLRKMGEGDLFGAATLFGEEGLSTLIVAEKACRVLLLEKEAVTALFSIDGAATLSYLSFLSDRIRFLNRKITYLTAGSAERKLALYLLDSADEDGSVRSSLSAIALSDMLDLGRASLYRAFDFLEEAGGIERNGKQITIKNKTILLQIQ